MTTTASIGNSSLLAARRRGELVASKYSLERPLAQGGMGSLWVARHVELDVEVAIKFSTMERGDAQDVRFRREARATARLKSPHIVHVFDYGIEGGEPYIAMELLDGESLRELLEREPRLPLARAAALVAEVAKGLVVAHEAGIVHRDLKPSNLFLARAGKDQVVKILDFGIAKASAEAGSEAHASASNLDAEATRVGAIIGSPAYMSPEQARGELVDKRSDLWSLAVVTFRMLTGSDPFRGANPTETLDKIRSEPVPRARSVAPELPPELDGFFERGLARAREQRFQSAQELSDALTALAARYPQAAGERASRPAERAIAPRDTVGRTGETRPIEVKSSRRLPRPSLRIGASAGVLGLFATLGLYFLLGRGPSDESSTGVEPKTVGETRSAAQSPTATATPPQGVEPLAGASASDRGASATAPNPPPRKHPARRVGERATAPADASRASEARTASPAAESELDPVFGLQR